MVSLWQTSAAKTAPAPSPARRYLALYLPYWATDYLKRADPSLAASSQPIVLWEKERGTMKIAAVDQRGSALGIYTGKYLADARAAFPDLVAIELDRERMTRIFADFADWHSNASPIVSVLDHAAPWGDLVLDITGVAHLFGGEAALLAQLTARLENLAFSVFGAIASTVGAAWALTRHLPGRILREGEERAVLSALPVGALRLDDKEGVALTNFGLKQIGQLYTRDRQSLQARFGSQLLLRLDQALGIHEERLVPRLPLVDYSVERRFAEPIILIEDVMMTTADLAITLAHQLEIAGKGARSFHLFLYRVDHRVMTLSIEAGQPTRNPTHIARLFSYRADRLEGEYDAGFGIDMIRLAAASLSSLDPVHADTFGGDDPASDLSSFFDRLISRLGAEAILRVVPVNTHMPEKAAQLLPVLSPLPAASQIPAIANPRPLRLLPRPEEISVIAEIPDAPPSGMIWRRVSYRFAKASGPERIGAEWFNQLRPLKRINDEEGEGDVDDTPDYHYIEGDDTRDYYITEDVDGHRFWLFRLGLFGIAPQPRWFMHGLFA